MDKKIKIIAVVILIVILVFVGAYLVTGTDLFTPKEVEEVNFDNSTLLVMNIEINGYYFDATVIQKNKTYGVREDTLESLKPYQKTNSNPTKLKPFKAEVNKINNSEGKPVYIIEKVYT